MGRKSLHFRFYLCTFCLPAVNTRIHIYIYIICESKSACSTLVGLGWFFDFRLLHRLWFLHGFSGCFYVFLLSQFLSSIWNTLWSPSVLWIIVAFEQEPKDETNSGWVWPSSVWILACSPASAHFLPARAKNGKVNKKNLHIYIYICVYSGRSRAEPQPHNIDFMQYLLFDPPGVGHLTKRHTHNLLFGLSMAYIEGSPPSRLCSICKGG